MRENRYVGYTIRKAFKKSNNPYLWSKGCYACNKPFEEEESYVRIDVETTVFRGDDEVFGFHKECHAQGVIKVSKELKAQLKKNY